MHICQKEIIFLFSIMETIRSSIPLIPIIIQKVINYKNILLTYLV